MDRHDSGPVVPSWTLRGTMDQKAIVMLLVQGSLILYLAAVGLRAQWRDVVATMNNPGGLLRAFIAVNVVVPLVAVLMCLLLPIQQDTKIGIVIMAVSPMAPFVAAKMVKVGQTASEAVGQYIAIILLAVIVVPLTIALLNAIFPADVSISPMQVAKLVLVTVVLPLVLALAFSSFFPAAAQRIARIFVILAVIIILLFAIALLYMAGGQLVGLVGDGTLLAIVVTVAAGLAAGHLLGGPRLADRQSLALDAATRHPGIAALIANSNSEHPRVLVAIVLFLITSIVVSTIYQQLVKRSIAKSEGAAP